jgi:osmotically-inducible protein OsmY
MLASGIVIALLFATTACQKATADKTSSDRDKVSKTSMDKSYNANDSKMTRAVNNARLESQIWTTYALSPYLRAHDIKVAVDNGKATLTGKVDEDVNKDLAKQIALGVNGIKSVDNQIEVRADYVAPKSTSGRSYGDTIDDMTITTAIKSKLLWSQYTEGFSTSVETKAGKVVLSGNVDTKEAKEHAGRLAKNTNGVISVNNKLVVDGKKSAKSNTARSSKEADGTGMADTWITTKVKSTYMYSSNVNGSDISVSTSGGIVSLKGKVDSGAERALAIELAQNVRGVKSVNSKGLAI